MVEPARIQILNGQPVRKSGRFVLYWMQQSQRARFNHALEYAIEQANGLDLAVVVCFGLMDDYPEANARHYAFMLDGLSDVSEQLRQRGIRFVLRRGQPAEVALHIAKDAAMLVCDRGYLRHQKQWREKVARDAACRVVQIESDVVVPVELVSDKAEFAARTIRPKIHKHLNAYLKPLKKLRLKCSSIDLNIRGENPTLADLKVDRAVRPVSRLKAGETEARKLLRGFIQHKLAGYSEARNEPSASATSMMSAYLHFGQISPLEIALAAHDSDSFLEELIVRRELSMNFVNFTSNYDSFDCLPRWAKATLKKHAKDKRPIVYSLEQLENAQTHDRWWNAAQLEMVRTGYMHNYMRMYWGKKIVEWSRSPRKAYETILYLNNRYFLDGRDPVSYANVGWIFGLHDRPWGERKIFGQIRYMNAAGLERKFDMEAYAKKVGLLSPSPPSTREREIIARRSAPSRRRSA